jgi:hypothetical protein
MIEARAMQDIRQVLLQKERQVAQLQKEVEALRFSVQILEEEERNSSRQVGSDGISTSPPKDNGAHGARAVSKQFP